ncbi:MAG: nuclear transport factor 2 family protein [Rhodospirillaceae bacterium]
MANDSETEAEKISGIIRSIFTAFEDHDPDGIEGHMHPDATVWDVFTPHLIRGRKERDAFHAEDQKQMQARGPLSLSLEAPEVSVWENTAIAMYYLHYAYQPPNAAEGRVRITDVFRRIENKWLIVHHHEGTVPSGIPPITETT